MVEAMVAAARVAQEVMKGEAWHQPHLLQMMLMELYSSQLLPWPFEGVCAMP